MNCPKCMTGLPDGSAFCSKCGAAQAASPGAPALPKAAPNGPEEAVWSGRFSGKSYAHYWLIWILYAAAIGYLSLAVLQPPQPWARWALAGLAAFPILPISWMTLLNKLSIRYRLTTQRLFKETGIISRKVSEVELIRIDDVEVRQNILQRLFNVGLVVVVSTDATDPRLELRGIADPVGVKEKIRGCVRQRRSGAMYMESL